MSHFYGTVQGHRGQASRCGIKNDSLVTQAAGWDGAVKTVIYYDEVRGHDRFEVSLIPWEGSEGTTRKLVSGKLSSNIQLGQPVETALNGIRFALQALDEYNND